MAWCQKCNWLTYYWSHLLVHICVTWPKHVITLRPEQNVCNFADDIFDCIFLTAYVVIWFNVSLKFVPKGLIDNKSALGHVMAWHRKDAKPLPEPMMIQFTNACMPQQASMSSHISNCGIFYTNTNTKSLLLKYHKDIHV